MRAMFRVALITFGCKLNQSETAALTREFESRGYKVSEDADQADVVLINTCVVTARSESKCRQAIRHILRSSPDATIIVAGCYSQVDANAIASMGVDYVLGSRDKFRLFDFFKGPGKKSPPVVAVSSFKQARSLQGETGRFPDQTRAFLKIQDGCDRRCSYCIVPFARGPSRSVPLEEVLSGAGTLVSQGFREIVLTGVHIGDYSCGKESGQLPELLRKLLTIEGLERIRLSSLDPEDVTEYLLDCMSLSDRICRHFHVALQSGSDTVLKRMDRPYTKAKYRSAVDSAVTRFGIVGMGTDVIVGFPGETEELFLETVDFIRSLPFSYLHVFPFSARRGTRAASMPDQVEPRLRAERANLLRAIGKEKKVQFMEKWIGKTTEVLLENRDKNGWMGGFSPEYLRVEVPYDARRTNRIVKVRAGKIVGQTVRGSISEERQVKT